MHSNISILQQATVNNPHQRYRLAMLEPLVTKKFAEIEQITQLRKTQGIAAVSQPLLLTKAKKLTDEIETTIREMESAENALLQKQSQTEVARIHKTILTFLAGICLNFLIVYGVYYLTYREISDRKSTAAALEQERDFSNAVLNTVGALVVVLDSQGKIIRFNRACEEATGYCAAQVQGKYFWQLFSIPTEAETAKTHWEKLLTTSKLSNQYVTGLFNRRYMEESLAQEIRRCDCQKQPLSIVILDVRSL